MANPIRRIVQLVLDRKAAQKTEADAKKSLGGIDKGLASLKKTAIAVGSALAAAFAVRKLVAFGKELVKTAADAQAIWKRLANAVENTGVSFDRAEGEIRQFANAMQAATTVGDEQFAEVLTELITTSGDYRKSLESVGIVADLAAAKQIDLRTAAQLVGRALVGETGTFKRYGIVIREGESAMDALRRQFRGFAENEATTFAGKMLQVNNAWGDFKEALGRALIAGAEGESLLDRLTLGIQNLTGAIQKYVNAAAGLPEAYIGEKETIESVITGSETAEQAIRRLQRLRELEVQRLAIAEQEAGKEPGLLSVLLTGRNYWKWRSRVEDAKDQVEGYRLAIGRLDEMIRGLQSGDVTVGPLTGTGPPGPPPTPEGGEDAEEKALTLLDIWKQYPGVMVQMQGEQQAVEAQAERIRAGWEALNQEMSVSPEHAKQLAEAVGQVGQAAEMSQMELMAIAQAGDFVGSVLSGIFSGDIGRMAKWKAEQNAILAAEQLAMAAAVAWIPGLQGEAAGHISAAALFASVSAAWAGLAAATGGFSGGGGPKGGAGVARDVGGPGAANAGMAGAEVHIYFDGPGFDALNPTVQRVVAGAVQNYGERYGPNARVITHRRNR